jgi:hypothetical protein
MARNRNEEEVSLLRIFGQEATQIEIQIEQSFIPILAIKRPWITTGTSIMWIHEDLEFPLHFLIIRIKSLRNVKDFAKKSSFLSISLK